ncbi:integrin alpha-PS4 [Amyelois transitella]|uniref:integrin alpha-PS4 n=1 Tax=Amyelois transitella TaxID=680683 RepID=UPI0029907714|nr:integrin alpha-PS4 [Amyelois transitella]
MGAYKKEDFIKRKLTIMSVNEESRFGTSIIANDLDGDGLQEIFVSAPYQGDGVLYVISGYEINMKINDQASTVDVSDFEDIQIIKRDDFKLFAFSVAAVGDLDNNGCDELAVGAPGSDKVIILRCIPTVTIKATAELVGHKIVPESVNEFKINVCIKMEYKSEVKEIAAKILLENTITGAGATRANIKYDPKLKLIDISNKQKSYCYHVNVTVVGNEPGLYKFKSEAKLITEGLQKDVFNVSWVRAGPYSNLVNTKLIERGCSGDDCIYHWKVEFLWSDGEIKDGYKYNIGSNVDETLTILIKNEGRVAYTACAVINVLGAPVDQLDCPNIAEAYVCRLPAGFMKNSTRDIQIKLKTSRLKNDFTGLNVTVSLFNDCDEKKTVLSKQFLLDYRFITDTVSVTGASLTRGITEKTMKSNTESIDIINEYKISNKGTILWKNIQITISIKESSLIKEIVVTSEKLKCKTNDLMSKICSLDLLPSSTVQIIITAVVLKRDIEVLLMTNILKITSELSLTLFPTSITKTASATSEPVFEKDSSIGQNKTVIILIAVLIAIILLVAFIYVLFRFGFFRRKQKEELQAEIRRRSFKRSTASSHQDVSLIEVDDDETNDDAFLCGTSSNYTRASQRSKTMDGSDNAAANKSDVLE